MRSNFSFSQKFDTGAELRDRPIFYMDLQVRTMLGLGWVSEHCVPIVWVFKSVWNIGRSPNKSDFFQNFSALTLRE